MRIGIIGPGLIWKNKHEPVLQTLPDVFQIVAFCDSNEQSRDEVQQKYPHATFMTEYEEFVKRDDIDGVVVLTPIPLNASVAIAALEAGKHVFVEKPMGCSLEEAQRMLAAAQRAGKGLYVLEQDGFDLRWQFLRNVVLSGEIGEIVTFGVVMHSRFVNQGNVNGGYGVTAWRREAAFPLGRLFDGGHHKFAQLAILFGQPHTVFASGVKLRPDYGEYDHILSHIVYHNGVSGSISYAGYLPKQRNFFHIRGTKGLVSVEEDTNTLVIEQEDGTTRVAEMPSEGAHATMWRDIAEAVSKGGAVPYSPQDALRDLTTLIRIDESIKAGQPMALRSTNQ